MSSSQPTTADERVCPPRQLLRCSVPVPGRESRGRKGQSPNGTARLRGDGSLRLDRQESGGESDHKAQSPLRDATGMTQTSRPILGSYRRIGDPKEGQRNRCADGSDAVNPRPSAALDPIRHAARDAWTAHKESEGTPRENLTAPTALVREQRRGPFRPLPGR